MTTPYSSRKSIALGDILNVSIDNSILNSDQFLKYNNTNNLWENSILGLDISTVNVYETENNTDYNLVLTDGNGNGKTLLVDSTTTPSTINPSSGDITIVDTLKINQNSIAIGKNSGNTNQSTYSISLGDEAGYLNQSFGAIAIGSKAGKNNQSLSSVAIGLGSGQDNQGNNCIAIGSLSGILNQVNNSIILNATGFDLSSGSIGLFVKPIRAESDVSTFESLYYDIGTGEIASGATPSGGGGSSTTIDITSNDSNTNYNFVFTNGNGTDKTLYVDNTTTPSSINPSTGFFNIGETISVQQYTTSIGYRAGISSQQDCCSFGHKAGVGSAGRAIAIGSFAGNSGQKLDNVSIGYRAGQSDAGLHSILLGRGAGRYSSADKSIVLNATGLDTFTSTQEGFYVKPITLESNVSTLTSLYYDTGTGKITYNNYTEPTNSSTIDVGFTTANNNLNFVFTTSNGTDKSLLVDDTTTTPSTFNPSNGYFNIADKLTVDLNRTRLGNRSGANSQNTHATAIGYASGETNQGTLSVAIGPVAGFSNQGEASVAIGHEAGLSNQGTLSIAIGKYAAHDTQQIRSIAIGNEAGKTTQGLQTVSLGDHAGTINQGNYGITIGTYAGFDNQKFDGIAIGRSSGQINQGLYSIAIGREAGYSNQPDNNICLNASGLTLNPANDGLYIRPINTTNDVSALKTLYYNTSTYEITAMQNNDPTFTSLSVSGNTTLTGGVMYNTPYIINNPSNTIVLSVNDSGRNIFINNTTNVSNIILPLESSFTNGNQMFFTFIVQSTSQLFYIKSFDNNIVGRLQGTRIDTASVKGNTLLEIGDSICLTNFPNGSTKTWSIFSGSSNLFEN
jgi:hypothetical protein